MAASLRETIRPDGLRILTKKLPTKRSFLTIITYFGRAHEPRRYPGLAHFLEHMIVGGTPRYSKNDIRQLLDYYCSDTKWNAATGHDVTLLEGETLFNRFGDLCDLFFHIYTKSIFPADVVKREKDVILDEIAIDKDDLENRSFQMLMSILWKKNPHTFPVLGTPKGISLLNRRALLDAYREWYTVPNTAVCAVGNVEHDFLTEKLEVFFPPGRGSGRIVHKKWPDETDEPPRKKEAVLIRKECENASINVGCKLPRFGQRDEDVFYVLSGVIDFLLESVVRDKYALSYSLSSIFFGNHSLGYGLSFFANCLPRRLKETKELIFKIVCETTFDQIIFKMQQEIHCNKWLVDLEDPATWNNLLVRFLIEGRSFAFIKNYITRQRQIIQGVTYEEVVALREKFLRQERLACAIITPRI